MGVVSTAAASAETSPPSGEPTAFTLFSVLRRDPADPRDYDPHDVPAAVRELEDLVDAIAGQQVAVRGFYDVSGLRADADLMIWMHAPAAESLQWGLRELRRARLIAPLLPTWSAMGVHRPAEFNAAHVPGFLRGEPARGWLTVYPFDRSYDWYLLPEDERKRMLAEHGRKGAAFTGVVANTVAAFALGDYEWLLPMEADDLVDLVDMMRELRYTEARMHVREEVPFYTGRWLAPAEVPEVLQ